MNLPSDEIPYEEEFIVYKPTQTLSAELNVLPGEVAYVGRIWANLLRMTTGSVLAVNAMGIFNVLSGDFFTKLANSSKVGDRYVLVDESGAFWVIHGTPARRPRFVETAHVKAVVTLLKIKPAGIP